MKRLSVSVLFIAAALLWLAPGCSTSSSPSAPPSVNITDVTNNLHSAMSTAAAMYAAVAPVVDELKPLVEQYLKQQTSACVSAECVTPAAAKAAAPAERSAAVICGLTKVDPKKYGGWKGECPGCDVDAKAFALACQSEGVPYEILIDSQANYLGIVASAKRAVSGLRAGDLLILYISGHGGQVADAAGDEADGKDETLCLWDGQLSDDAVWQLLAQVPAGVRVWMITDTCNSGTNYRAPHSYRAKLEDGPALLHWGGCADGKSSFGSAQGGTFTTAMVDSYKSGQSYDAWFRALRRRMPFTQRPSRESVGDDFGGLPAFR